MTAPTTWIVKHRYELGEHALVCGKEALVVALPRSIGCKLCPAVTPAGACKVNTSACCDSIGALAFWADPDLYNLERLKGNVDE
jgi:Fe-S-cluster-containing hydrogenase component 2